VPELLNTIDTQKYSRKPVIRIVTKPKITKSIYGKYDDEINRTADFINGVKQSSHRPARTVISQSCSEYAANKPVVKCKIANVEKNVLFDTGCESNVVDYNFLKRLSKTNHVKMLHMTGNMKCANGSPIKIFGYTKLDVTIGDVKKRMQFTVLDEVFPNVIIGIRQMKQDHIDVQAYRDCIKVGTNCVPFVSKVKPIKNC